LNIGIKPLPLPSELIILTNSFMATMQMLVDKYPDGYEGWEMENRELIMSVKQQNAGSVDLAPSEPGLNQGIMA
jgi:hypothetical protein